MENHFFNLFKFVDYVNSYKDLKFRKKENAWKHFNKFGWKEKRYAAFENIDIFEQFTNWKMELSENNNKMIIGIISCHKNKKKQEFIRKRWLEKLKYYPQFDFFFVVGGSRELMVKEDTIYINCPDSYDYLSLKIGLFIKYIYSYTDYNYILKIDDDCYLNVDKLAKIDYCRHHFLGSFISRNDYNSNWKKEQNLSDKIIDSEIEFDYFGGGFSYVLSRKSMSVIVENLKELSQYYLEDVAVSKILYYYGDIKVQKVKEYRCIEYPLLKKKSNYLHKFLVITDFPN